MSEKFSIVSPVDDSIFATLSYANREEAFRVASKARAAAEEWGNTPFAERRDAVFAFLSAISARRNELALDVAWQMGRPLWLADETSRLEEWTHSTAEAAEHFLRPVDLPQDEDLRRHVEMRPLGVCLAISAWNYPVAMASCLVMTPLLMGNVVIYKQSPQTALIANTFAEAAAHAGLPPNVFQAVHLAHPDAEALIGSGAIDVVQFIGSTLGGQAVYDAGRGTFTRFGLELGGKDPAYIRADAQIESIIDDIVDGCYGNSGQSCCSVERIYVHRDQYDRFVKDFVAASEKVTIGHPIDEQPLLGPLVSRDAGDRVRRLIDQAVSAGARPLLDTAGSGLDGAYVAPQVLIDVDHSMQLFQEEIFAPVIPIMAIDSDEEAVALMNDSEYGLTASIWSQNMDEALRVGGEIDCGTLYVNRCDHADRYLSWGGVKRSGIGRSYGIKGFDGLVEARSVHARVIS